MKFSIVIPIYNSEKYLEKCINSIINQTYDNYEILLINDGSTDESDLICKKFVNDFANVKYYFKENTGVSDTRNFGLEKSSGDFITFIDSDDWIDNNTLKEINDIIKNDPEIEIVQSNLKIFNDSNQIDMFKLKKNILVESGTIKDELINTIIAINYGKSEIFGNCRCAGGKFYKRKLLMENNIRFPYGIKSFEDGIMNLKAYMNASKIKILAKSFYFYRQHSDSTTHSYANNQYEQNTIIIEEIEKIIGNNKLYNDVFKYCKMELFNGIVRSKLMLANNYKKVKKELNIILHNDIFFNFINNIEFKKLNRRDKIFYILEKYNLYYFLYIFYKFKKR